jgi:hypothetical protein
MRFNHFTVFALPGLFQCLTVTCLPKRTLGVDIVDFSTSTDDDNEHENLNTEFNDEFLDFHSHLASRLLQDDELCSNACDSADISNLRASMIVDASTVDKNGSGVSGHITGFFSDNKSIFGRLMNGLFRVINGRQEDDPKYPIPTASILPLLSNYSTKFRSLAALIREESVNDAALSTTPDAIRMMYNISANNMEAVATMLDPILENMRQHETMDVRAISCDMVQILTLLRDVTVPNIQLMTQLIYTKSNNPAMNNKFPQKYTPFTGESITSSTALTTCLSESTSSSISSRVAFGNSFNSLFSNGASLGPIGNIVSIIVLIILFPFSVVVSLIGIIVFILLLLAYVLLPIPKDHMIGWIELFVLVLFAAIIALPIALIFSILENIGEFLAAILDPFLPDRPTPAPNVFTPAPFPGNVPITPSVTVPVPTNSPISPPATAPIPVNGPINLPISGSGRDAQQASEVAYRLSMVLESPINTIINVLQDGNMFADTNRGDGMEQLDCDMAAVQCKNDALLDVLPF